MVLYSVLIAFGPVDSNADAWLIRVCRRARTGVETDHAVVHLYRISGFTIIWVCVMSMRDVRCSCVVS